MGQQNYNLASIILKQAQDNPDKLALIIPRVGKWEVEQTGQYTFKQFWQRVSEISSGIKQNFNPGDKVSVLMTIDIDLYASVIAMFACKVIPVFMEPGMGRKNLAKAIRTINLRSFIGKQQILKYRWLLPGFFSNNILSLDSAGINMKRMVLEDVPIHIESISDNQTALITFTSGSSGNPKGANRTHKSLFYQHVALKSGFPNMPGDVDMTCFPMVVLHNLCCGVTSYIPPINFKNVAEFNPSLVLSEMNRHHVTRFTAAPKFLDVLCSYMQKHEIRNKNIRALAVGGAIVGKELVEKLDPCFPQSTSWVIYGSTEAEPMAKLGFKDFLANCNINPGHLVGKAVPEANIKIIDSSKLDVDNLPPAIDELELENGKIGEIVVSGDHVLASYIANQKANRQIKLKFTDGTLWHRTQDLGKFDHEKNLWLFGRLGDVILNNGQPLYVTTIEKKINQLGLRSAILPMDDNIVLVIESPRPLAAGQREQISEIMSECNLEHYILRNIKSMPVDRRHRSKTDRLALKHLI